MTLTLTLASKLAAVDALVDRVDLGSTNAAGRMDIYTAGGSTLLVSINLANPAFSAAASPGTATLLGVPLSGVAGDSGAAALFLVVDRDETEVYRGTVTEAGGGGDAIIDDADITAGDTVQLNSHTVTQP